ncbi:exported hypothetical protein [Cupriavidus necator]|uniref:Uncharacterized protein n=1 Tax=Cupriavidus necator TaxID=106590 RepID=A0A1K0IBM1_CUPNE|nr:exported hypothetical protein [Cupriavidus necator]
MAWKCALASAAGWPAKAVTDARARVETSSSFFILRSPRCVEWAYIAVNELAPNLFPHMPVIFCTAGLRNTTSDMPAATGRTYRKLLKPCSPLPGVAYEVSLVLDARTQQNTSSLHGN